MSYAQVKKILTNKSLTVKSLTIAGLLATAGSVSAGEDNGLKAWTNSANKAVDEVMVYPTIAFKRGLSGRSAFEVTIDRNGDVVDSQIMMSAGDNMLRSAAKRVLRKTDFPALPASYRGEELRFSLRLNYAIAGSASEARALKRGTKVRSEEISSGTPVASRITILSQAE